MVIKKLEHIARLVFGHLHTFLPFFHQFLFSSIYRTAVVWSPASVFPSLGFYFIFKMKDLVWLIQNPILFFFHNCYAWLNRQKCDLGGGEKT